MAEGSLVMWLLGVSASGNWLMKYVAHDIEGKRRAMCGNGVARNDPWRYTDDVTNGVAVA
jgi:hypothetical protein